MFLLQNQPKASLKPSFDLVLDSNNYAFNLKLLFYLIFILDKNL